MIGAPEIIFIVLIVLLLFGGKDTRTDARARQGRALVQRGYERCGGRDKETA